MTLQQPTIITATNKKPILMDISYEGEQKGKPIVLFCHGYKGFKDWGAWHLVAKMFVAAGYCFVKFNFSHNGGTPENPIDFPDLEAFANNNFSTELDDIDRVLSHLDATEVSIIGHSRGAGIVLIKAEEDPRINKVVSWAGVSDFKARFQIDSEAFAAWKKTGVTYIENARTKQQLPHYWQFFEDFLAYEERLTIQRAVRQLKKPQLIVHGSDDPTVTLGEAKAIHSWNPDSQLEVIEGGDHVFGAKHPWNESELPDDLKKVAAITISFLS
jgi:pimeloyl-ACP methyl ester carboxylesterase